MGVILEGIVTTLGPDGTAHIAAMGLLAADDDPDLARFTLRPFRTATTYRNLKATGEGVFHITDDALAIASAVVGRPKASPLRPASLVRGVIWEGCCRYHEFRVVAIEDAGERATIEALCLARGHEREYRGLNRARNAVVEAAILASRVGILPADEIRAELRRLGVIVRKTGGPAEFEAWGLLTAFVEEGLPGPTRG